MNYENIGVVLTSLVDGRMPAEAAFEVLKPEGCEVIFRVSEIIQLTLQDETALSGDSIWCGPNVIFYVVKPGVFAIGNMSAPSVDVWFIGTGEKNVECFSMRDLQALEEEGYIEILAGNLGLYKT